MPDDDIESSGAKDLAPDPWVKTLGRRVNKPADAVGLVGYVGEGRRNGEVRLYMDVELRAFIELKADDIIYRERQGGGPSRASVVMVRRKAPIGRPGKTAADAQGWFLRGAMMDGFLKDVQPSTATGLVWTTFWTTLPCAVVIITCFLCVTPSCDDLTIPPLLCDPEDGAPQPPTAEPSRARTRRRR
jgi:hypothetical protein